MNWFKDGRTDRFRYVHVEWPSMKEIGQFDNVISCTITENSLSSLKASGTFDYAMPIAVGEDLIRVYSDSELDGETETVCHGTFFATTPSTNYSGVTQGGTADMYSTLWILQQNKTQETFTVAVGTKAVKLAASLASGYGNNLKVVATASSSVVKTSHAWDAGTTYLEIINWLLDFAGYTSAGVDAYGNIIMTPYVEPSAKAPIVTFSDTRETVSEPSFTHEFDTFEIPNKVVCVCSNADSAPMTAVAINDDPENPYSTVSRKKTLVRMESMSDIADQATLNAKARELLLSAMSVVETVEIGHSYQPFSVGDAILMDYEKSGYKKKLVSASREMQMIPGIRCRTTARCYVNLWEVE